MHWVWIQSSVFTHFSWKKCCYWCSCSQALKPTTPLSSKRKLDCQMLDIAHSRSGKSAQRAFFYPHSMETRCITNGDSCSVALKASERRRIKSREETARLWWSSCDRGQRSSREGHSLHLCHGKRGNKLVHLRPTENSRFSPRCSELTFLPAEIHSQRLRPHAYSTLHTFKPPLIHVQTDFICVLPPLHTHKHTPFWGVGLQPTDEIYAEQNPLSYMTVKRREV